MRGELGRLKKQKTARGNAGLVSIKELCKGILTLTKRELERNNANTYTFLKKCGDRLSNPQLFYWPSFGPADEHF